MIDLQKQFSKVQLFVEIFQDVTYNKIIFCLFAIKFQISLLPLLHYKSVSELDN